MTTPNKPATARTVASQDSPKAFDIILEGGVYDNTRMRVSADVKVVKKRFTDTIKDGEEDVEHIRILGYYKTKRTKKDNTGVERLVFEARGHEGSQGPATMILPDDVELDERPDVRAGQLSILEDRAYAEEQRREAEKAANNQK